LLAQQPQRLRFSRLDPAVASGSSADPFSGLYVGTYGTCGPEILHITRGRWGDELSVPCGADDGPDGSFCVTAVKVTGDRNVPAGVASFRARVGPQHRLPLLWWMYPEELGVVARYGGEGRGAKRGFRSAWWMEGELLVLDGRPGGMTQGAELAFVWAMESGKRFLILFHRLRLPA
jgi:hypothetical protein